MPPAPRAPTLVLVLLVLAAGTFQLHNWDIGLHARTGQWIVEHGAVPRTNVLSELHADWPTVDDKWAFQVLAHLLHDRLGPNACIAARLALLLATFLLAHATARRLGAGPWCSLLLLALAVVAARARFAFRPDLVSLLLTVACARELLLHAPSRGQALRLLALQVAWVNVHGYFITGPLMVATAGGAALVAGAAGDPHGRRRGAALLALSAGLALACLLNPAGLDGALHPLRILQDLREHREFYTSAIIEFRPTFAADPRQPWDRSAFVLLLAVSAVALAVDAWRAWRRRCEDPAALRAALLAAALAGLFAAMAPSLRRNMAPFALVAAPLAAAAVTRLAGRRFPAPVLPVALCTLVAFGELSDRSSIHDGLERRAGLGRSRLAYPDLGIDFIARELPRARVFTAFSWGSTFTGRRWPEQVAATDGNTHGYPTTYLIEVMSALSGADPLAFGRITARDGEDAALLPVAGPLSIALLRDPEWVLACVGIRETVWVRRSAVDPEWLARHDLVARWRAGEAPDLPDTPPCGAVLGPFAACLPVAEVDQALLLRFAGLREAALARVRDGLWRAPDDAEANALEGLLLLELGRRAEAEASLRRALDAGGFNRLADEARRALAASG